MNTTNDFHDAKSNLECALSEFIKTAIADDRNIYDELDEALFNSCKESGYDKITVERD